MGFGQVMEGEGVIFLEFEAMELRVPKLRLNAQGGA
jgi:hypothetical protein